MGRTQYVFIHRKKSEESSLHFYFSGKEDCDPGHSFGPAVRNQYLMHFVTGGHGTYTMGGKEFPVGPGEVFLIYPGDVTFYRADTKTPWIYSWIAFHGKEADRIMKRCGFTKESPVVDYARNNPQRKERVENLLAGLMEQAASKNQGEYGLKGYLYLIFDQLELRDIQDGGLREQYVRKAKNFIAENFSYDLKIQDVADHVGLDRTYLYRLFREHQGKSPYEYLLNLRFQEARNMLRFSDMSVTMIACSCGFKDSSAFCRHFKKAYGQSPLAYRKSQQRP